MCAVPIGSFEAASSTPRTSLMGREEPLGLMPDSRRPVSPVAIAKEHRQGPHFAGQVSVPEPARWDCFLRLPMTLQRRERWGVPLAPWGGCTRPGDAQQVA